MIPVCCIDIGKKFRILKKDGLWDFALYKHRTGTQWSGVFPAPLPPLTQVSELRAVLQPGTMITVTKPPDDSAALSKGILYHADRTSYKDLAYQCLHVEVTVDGEAKSGFVWTGYMGENYIEPVTTVEVRDKTITKARAVIGNRIIGCVSVTHEPQPYDDPCTKSIWSVSEEHATYPCRPGNSVVFYNDASVDRDGTAGAFHDLSKAIAAARRFIFVAGWSFHPYMRLTPGSEAIGFTLNQWAKDHATGLVAIHTWNATNAVAPNPQNDDGVDIFAAMHRPPNLLWRASSRSGENGGVGAGWAHHQKFVVMDCEGTNGKRQVCVFVGGLDLSKGRYDWHEHLISPTAQDIASFAFFRRKTDILEHTVHEWYNPEFDKEEMQYLYDDTVNGQAIDTTYVHPRQPWHDVHCKITGPAAWDVVREFVGRWQLNPSTFVLGDHDEPSKKLVLDQFRQLLLDRDLYVPPDTPASDPGPLWVTQICRSITRDHWGAQPVMISDKRELEWKFDKSADLRKEREQSIQKAYLKAIEHAENFIYIETQFFIGSGAKWTNSLSSVANGIPEALVERIVQRKKGAKKAPFHVYLILPMFPEDSGGPSSGIAQGIRDLQWRSIEYMIVQLEKYLGEQWKECVTVGFLANWHPMTGLKRDGSRIARVKTNKRYMVYVHSKMMIVDDKYIIIGSANLNERSLAGGRDSEICAGMWPEGSHLAAGMQEIRKFRSRLWNEHFGINERETTDSLEPEDKKCVDKIQKIGRDNYALLVAGKHEMQVQKRGHFCMWPLEARPGLGVKGGSESLQLIDADPNGDDWFLWPTHWDAHLGVPYAFTDDYLE